MAAVEKPYFLGNSNPGGRAAAVTPDDDNDLTYVARALYVGGTGTVKITTVGNDDVSFVGVPAGGYVIARVAKVWSTGTTATSIVALGDW